MGVRNLNYNGLGEGFVRIVDGLESRLFWELEREGDNERERGVAITARIGGSNWW